MFAPPGPCSSLLRGRLPAQRARVTHYILLIVCLGPHPRPQSVLDLGLAGQRAEPCLGTSPCRESSPVPHRLRILCRISYQRNVVTVCRHVGCWEGQSCQRDLSPNPDLNLLPKKGQLPSVPRASSSFLLKLS